MRHWKSSQVSSSRSISWSHQKQPMSTNSTRCNSAPAFGAPISRFVFAQFPAACRTAPAQSWCRALPTPDHVSASPPRYARRGKTRPAANATGPTLAIIPGTLIWPPWVWPASVRCTRVRGTRTKNVRPVRQQDHRVVRRHLVERALADRLRREICRPRASAPSGRRDPRSITGSHLRPTEQPDFRGTECRPCRTRVRTAVYVFRSQSWLPRIAHTPSGATRRAKWSAQAS